MASEAQIQANRANAQKSTGPRTAEGKATVAQNAVKHGLRAEQMVIKGEDPGQFESYREQMLGELHPDGALESMLAERAVGLAWRLRRAERLQVEAFDALLDKYENDPVRRLGHSMHLTGASEGASALGRVVTRDFGHAQVLYRLGMYERRIEHSLYKTLNELQKHRLLREVDETAAQPALEPPAPPAETPARQTKPNSGATGSEAGIPQDDGALPSQLQPARADRGVACLTEPWAGHRLSTIGTGREAGAPAGIGRGRPPWDMSHCGKEESR